MSLLPLTGTKILDLADTREGSPCARILAGWGGEQLVLPSGLKPNHAEGRRILLMLAQEADVLVTRGEVDLAMLHEYNPMLIVCRDLATESPWEAACGILIALLQRDRTGLGQLVTLQPGEGPVFTGFAAVRPPAADPDETLMRLGYAPEAIAALRRDGIL